MRTLSENVFRYDMVRGALGGILETGLVTFGLLIAVRYFEAGAWWKGCLAAGSPLGLLLNPLSLSLASRISWRASQFCALYLCVGGCLLIGSAWVLGLQAYALLLILAYIAMAQQVPLLTQIFADNYPSAERGQRLAKVIALSVVSSSIFGALGGWLLDVSLLYYQWLLTGLGLTCFVLALVMLRIPSRRLADLSPASAWGHLQLAWKDKLFGWMLFCWMLAGFGVLMTIPLRIEYLANDEFGINISNSWVVVFTLIIPAIVRVAGYRLWGLLFDKIHFIGVRMVLNSAFLIGTLIFFTQTNYLSLALAAVFWGIGNGGGMIAWNLWITKISEPQQYSAYMSVHTAFTGFRGCVAPFLGYAIVSSAYRDWMVWIACTLLLLSTLCFAFVWSHPRFASNRYKSL